MKPIPWNKPIRLTRSALVEAKISATRRLRAEESRSQNYAKMVVVPVAFWGSETAFWGFEMAF